MQSSIKPATGRQEWAINGRFLTQRVTGVQRYASEIVAALDSALAENGLVSMRLIIPPNCRTQPALSSIEIRRTVFGSGHLWDQCVLPFYAKSGVLSLCNLGPLLSSNQIVCIHDANVFIEPESYSRTFGLAYRTFLPWIGRRASRVATVSNFAANMLEKFGICPRQKIFVAPNGHEHVLRWDAQRANVDLIRKLRRPYILVLGSVAKHKNVDIILRLADVFDEAGIDIVVVGAASKIFSSQQSYLERPNIQRTGYVTDDDLAALYERALGLVFPSKTEGFGIPPLEAMAQGCPVIASKIPSLMEVGGEAIIYVEPDDSKGWKEAVLGLSRNADARRNMSELGKRRSRLFSWRRSAELYLEQITSCGPKT